MAKKQLEQSLAQSGTESKGRRVLERLIGALDALPSLFAKGMNAAFRTLLGGSQIEREILQLQPIVDQVNYYGVSIADLSDRELAAKTDEFKERLAAGETLDDILPDAFAVVREASSRTIGLRHFDVQIIGGIILHQGKIAEMVTGEGKTLVATLPAYLNALAGHPVHVITTTDYLAQRDRDWMGPIYEFLGLTCGVIYSEMPEVPNRRDAYRCDITYGKMSEFGFDYLRKNLESRLEYQVQRELNYAIIDEVDSVLIDEARTPLIISGSTGVDPGKIYSVVKRIVDELTLGIDYTVNEKDKTVILTDVGLSAVEEAAHRGIYEGDNLEWTHYVEQAIRAKELYRENRDYVIKDGEIVIVDQFTGRLQVGRRWSDCLHEAIEAKHGLRVRSEQRTIATVTTQNFFRLYNKLAGMTGTALTQAEEFLHVYGLEVVPIPTHMPLRRVGYPDVIYRSEEEKTTAVVEEIVRCHEEGLPVLVGTTSVEKSAQLSAKLSKEGIAHEVLNAKNHAREAEIIAQAGQVGAVTISTNMAGRGTDIMLGPGVLLHRDGLDDADMEIRCRGIDHSGREVFGGLHVIATERHEARRIDDQLRGRAGRQGDPGSSRFFLSLEDDLMRLFMGNWTRDFLQRSGIPPGQPIESGMVTRAIQKAQQKVESRNFEMRKGVLEYDELMSERRKIIYGDRQTLVEGGTKESLRQLVSGLLARHLDPKWEDGDAEAYVVGRNYKPFADALAAFAVDVSRDEWNKLKRSELRKFLADKVQDNSSVIRDRAESGLNKWVDDTLKKRAPIGSEAFPTEWDFDLLAETLRRLGVDKSTEQLKIDALSPIVELVTKAFGDSSEGKNREGIVRLWVENALEMDATMVCGSPEWDILSVQIYAGALGISLMASDLSGRVHHKSRLSELLVGRILQAPWCKEGRATAERLATAVTWVYLGSAMLKQRPGFEHFCYWAKHRLDIGIEPSMVAEAVNSVRQGWIDNALESKARKWKSGDSLEQMLLAIAEEFLSMDLSAADRNLTGLVEGHPDLRKSDEIDSFELSKLSYDDLRQKLLDVFKPLVCRQYDPIAVEPHLLNSLENGIDVVLDRLVSRKELLGLADECYADIAQWAGKLGLSIHRDKWMALGEEELVHHFATQALEVWQDKTDAQIIEDAFTVAFDQMTDASGFGEQSSYSSLIAWGTTWTGEAPVSGGLAEGDASRLDLERRRALDARMKTRRRSLLQQTREDTKGVEQHISEKRSDMRKQFVGELGDVAAEVSDNVNEQVEFLCKLALSGYERAAGSLDDVRFDQLAGWLSEHFGIQTRSSDLEEAAYGVDSSLNNYINSKLQGQFARRNSDRMVEATVDSVMALFANPKECVFRWNLSALEKWAHHARIDFSCETAEEEFHEIVKQFFLNGAQARLEGCSRRVAVFSTIRSAFSSLLSVVFSAEGRHLNELAAHMGRQFQLYGIALSIDHYRRLSQSAIDEAKKAVAAETSTEPEGGSEASSFGKSSEDISEAEEVDRGGALNERRLLQLSRVAPKYELTPIELSKRRGDAIRDVLISEARRLFFEARNLLPQRIAEFGGESLLSRGRMLLIHTIDERWIEFVHAMSALQQGIGFRGYAGIDPKVAFKKEGGEMYLAMVTEAKESFARLFGATIRGALEGQASRVTRAYAGGTALHDEAQSAYKIAASGRGQGREDDRKSMPLRVEKPPGRNDPCPCGAKDEHGRPIKYKKCHGRTT